MKTLLAALVTGWLIRLALGDIAGMIFVIGFSFWFAFVGYRMKW